MQETLLHQIHHSFCNSNDAEARRRPQLFLHYERTLRADTVILTEQKCARNRLNLKEHWQASRICRNIDETSRSPHQINVKTQIAVGRSCNNCSDDFLTRCVETRCAQNIRDSQSEGNCLSPTLTLIDNSLARPSYSHTVPVSTRR